MSEQIDGHGINDQVENPLIPTRADILAMLQEDSDSAGSQFEWLLDRVEQSL